MRRSTDNLYYENMWNNLVYVKNKIKEIKEYTNELYNNKNRYMYISNIIGVPWEVIGAIHMLEADFNFKCNLHNGEPWNKITKLVPKGRGPFVSWEDSAVDALEMKRRLFPTIWNVGNTGRFLEGYNGFGYTKFGKDSPYLWSFSVSGLDDGKYVEDGEYNPYAHSDQCGAMVVIKMLHDLGLSNLFNKTITIEKLVTTNIINNNALLDITKYNVPNASYSVNQRKQISYDLQRYLNDLLIKNNLKDKLIKVDGFAGKETSDVYKFLFGKYLNGDPRLK